MAAKKLFLIDAMGFVFRAFHAPMERLRAPSGLPTKVPYLFVVMLRRLLKNFQPDYLAVVFDPPGPTFRDKLFADYKAQRPPMPEDLSVQLPFVRRLCEAMRLPVIEFPGYEADDAIGALAQQAARKGLDVFIVTSDKDMMQLVGKRIQVLRPQSRAGGEEREVDAKGVEEILGVPPEQVVDLMALMGDSIDNIPGAKGIGEKGAVELIRRFGSAEAALENANKVESKRYREALQTQRDQVMLSKELARISTDAPVPLELEALARREPSVQDLRALYSELGFSSLLKELPAQAPSAAGTQDYAPLESPAALEEFLASLSKERPAALWLVIEPGSEEEEEPGFGSRVTSIEISPEPGVSRFFSLGVLPGFQLSGAIEKRQNGRDTSASLPSTSLGAGSGGAGATAALRAWLADPTRPKIIHDPKLVELLLGQTRGVLHAVELYSYLLRPTTSKHSLADVALRHLSAQPTGAPGESADLLGRVAPLLRAEVEKAGLLRVFETIDLPLAPVLARMERHGVLVDPDALTALSSAAEKEIRSLERRIWDLAGTKFNVNSPQQLAEILFDKMNLQPQARRGGRAKARSTAAEVLEELALTHELPKLVLEFRELSKLKSTYADALPRLIHPETGRIHTRLSQTGTATGRLSSSNPNLQNIPVRSELGRQIRAAFTASPGCVLLSADYSQIELRLLAHFSQDAVLLDSFHRGEDIHARTAQEVFGVGPFAQTPEHRRVAKVINFGIIYGLSSFGLAQQLGIDAKEASAFIKAYFDRYPRVREYLESSVASARKLGYATNLFGRTRPIPEINSPQANLRNFAERTALNTPLQGTAADLIKLAMIEIDRRLGADAALRDTAKMILQVHDELLFEVREDVLNRLCAIVKPAMESVDPQAAGFGVPLSVPLVVEMKSGKTWAELK